LASHNVRNTSVKRITDTEPDRMKSANHLTGANRGKLINVANN